MMVTITMTICLYIAFIQLLSSTAIAKIIVYRHIWLFKYIPIEPLANKISMYIYFVLFNENFHDIVYLITRTCHLLLECRMLIALLAL